MKKIFVLDTNVILHDSSCINNFDEHDVVIPLTVIEELDHITSPSETVMYHAREFVRIIDNYSTKALFNGGVSLGEDKGNLYVRAHKEYHANIENKFLFDKGDHRIINQAYLTSIEHADKQTVLVTKDANLRIKAKALGVQAEDYTTDKVETDHISDNVQTINNITDEQLAEFFYQEEGEDKDIKRNSFIIGNDANGEQLYIFNNALTKQHVPIIKRKASSIAPKNKEQILALHILMDSDIPLICMTGPAGTGKTILALAAALEQKKKYWQILLTRPIVPLSGKDIGALPGDVNEKIRPYMQPLFDNLGVIKESCEDKKSADSIGDMLEREKIIIEPLTYIRGRSLQKKFLIIDEGQNLTPHEVKTIVTRAGKGTKIIFTGDIFQIDNKYLDEKSNGLSYLIDKMVDCPLFAHINLTKGERSELAEIAGNLL